MSCLKRPWIYNCIRPQVPDHDIFIMLKGPDVCQIHLSIIIASIQGSRENHNSHTKSHTTQCEAIYLDIFNNAQNNPIVTNQTAK